MYLYVFEMHTMSFEGYRYLYSGWIKVKFILCVNGLCTSIWKCICMSSCPALTHILRIWNEYLFGFCCCVSVGVFSCCFLFCLRIKVVLKSIKYQIIITICCVYMYVCMYVYYVCMSKKRLPPIKFHSHLTFST